MHVQGTRARIYRGRRFRPVSNLEEDASPRAQLVGDFQHKLDVLRKYWKLLERNYALESLESRSKILTALRHWSFGLLHKVFRAWKMFTVQIDLHRTNKVRAYRFRARVLERRVFSAWHHFVSQKRIRLLKARMLWRKLDERRNEALKQKVLETWFRVTVDHGRKADLHHKVVSMGKYFERWKRRIHDVPHSFANRKLLGKAIMRWRSICSDSREEELNSLLELFHDKRNRKTKSLFLELLSKNRETQKFIRLKEKRDELLAYYFRWTVLVKGAFQVWKKMASDRLQRFRLERQVSERWQRSLKRRIFDTWLDHVVQVKIYHRQVQRALRLWAVNMEKRYFTLWLLYLTRRVEKKGMMRDMERYRRKKLKTKAMSRLKTLVANRRLTKSARGDRFYRVRSLRGALQDLKRRTLYLTENRHKTAIALRHYQGKVLETWRRSAKMAARESEIKAQTATEFFQNTLLPRRMQAALESWIEFYSKSQIVKINKARGDTQYRTYRLRSSLRRLWKYAQHRHTNAILNLQARSYYLKKLIGSHFGKWVSFHQWWDRETAKLVLAVKHWKKTLSMKVWDGWVHFVHLRQHKKQLAMKAMNWRREYLLKAGVSAWLENGLAILANRDRQVVAREAGKAARLATNVREIAFHWRALTLKRRLERRPIEREKFLSHSQPLPPAWSFDAQSQVLSGMSANWLEERNDQNGTIIGRRQRPAPRKPFDILLDGDAQGASHQGGQPMQMMTQSCLSFRPSHGALRTRRPSANSVERRHGMANEEIIRAKLKEFMKMKQQITQDRKERDIIRQTLVNQNPFLNYGNERHHQDALVLLEKLNAIQQRRARFEAERAQVLPLLKSIIANQ